jgi:hypothetical protein
MPFPRERTQVRFLTPDRDTGLGAWTDEQIMPAIRTGQRPDRRMLVPVRSIPAIRFKAPDPVKPGEKASAPYLKMVND